MTFSHPNSVAACPAISTLSSTMLLTGGILDPRFLGFAGCA